MFRLALIGYIVKTWYVFIAWLVAGMTATAIAISVALLMHYLFAGL